MLLTSALLIMIGVITTTNCNNVMSGGNQNQHLVKVKETWKYNSEAQTDGTLLLKEEYDGAGNKIKESSYDGRQVPITTTEWHFNQHGDCITQTVKYLDKKETLKFRYDYQYDGDKKIKVTKRTGNNDIIEERYFSYDHQKEERILVAGELNKIKIYSQEDLLGSEISYVNNLKINYQYDNRRNVLRRVEKRTNRPDKIIAYQNAYDEKGRLIQQRIGAEVKEFDYDLENKMIKQRIMRSGKVEQMFIYNYY